jgi:NAD(P)-dependent dehydrogenase (short-subunit alcohol dehydrogenase family)
MAEGTTKSGHALVTGAGRRVGAAIATHLAQSGWAVTIHYKSSRTEAEELAESLRRNGAMARALGADLARPDEAVGMIEAAESERPLSLLVNSAAGFSYDEAGSITADNLHSHFTVNAAMPILMAQALHCAKRASGGKAVVINLLDNKIFAPNADYFSYSVAKFALAGATKMLAMALAPQVRVCGIAPAVLLVSGAQTAENYGRTSAINPMRRPTELRDVCRAVTYLAETEAANGDILVLDGGQSLMNLPRDVAFLDPTLVERFQ